MRIYRDRNGEELVNIATNMGMLAWRDGCTFFRLIKLLKRNGIDVSKHRECRKVDSKDVIIPFYIIRRNDNEERNSNAT